jgi:hypothetical protein
MSRRTECAHGIPSVHQAGRTAHGHPVWRCTECGTEDVWRTGWRYYGTVECTRCWRPQVDRVQCPACATKEDLA